MPVILEARDLSKNYGPFQALQGVSFTLEPGEVVGFLGPNGAGKSTTMKILTDSSRPAAEQPRLLGTIFWRIRLAAAVRLVICQKNCRSIST